MKDLGKTIALHRKQCKLKQSELAIELEKYNIFIKPNTISAWESGLSLPNSRQFLAVCTILQIYDIYTEFIEKNPLDPFQNLNKEGIAKAMDYIQLLEKSGDYKVAEVIPITSFRKRKVFYLPVSAGTGSFLDGEDYEMYSAADIPEESSFGVHVRGDSMEPRFHDNDLVWVEQTEQLEDGEIGIFYLDGNAYIKKLQTNSTGSYLVSLNSKYDPIPITENSSFRIFGRVLS